MGKILHGMAIHGNIQRPFRIWDSMLQRCTNPRNTNYRYYGKRGIIVCERWMIFTNFWEDMKEGYAPELMIDRIDNAGNYEPGNVRWVTQLKQQNNRTNNVHITHDGKTLTIAEWARHLGIKAITLHSRLNKLGWPIADALGVPARRYGN